MGHLRAFAAAVVLAVVAFDALAFRPSPTYSNGRTAIPRQAVDGAWSSIVMPDGSISSTRIGGIPGPQNVSMGGTLTQGVSSPAVRRFLAAGVRGLPVVGTGIALWDLFDAAGVRPGSGTGLLGDPGADPGPQSLWCGTAANPTRQVCTGSPGATLQQIADSRAPVVTSCGPAAWRVQSFSPNPPTAGTTSVSGTLERDRCGCGGSPVTCSVIQPPVTEGASVSRLTVNGCAGGEPARPDGKCRTGVFDEPLTDDEAAERLPQVVPALEPLIATEFGRGREVVGDTDAIPSGLQPLSGPTTRRTLGDGTVEETEVQFEPIQEPGGVRWRERRTITTTDPEGTVTVREEQTTPPPLPGSGAVPTPAPEPQEDLECGLPGYPRCLIDETGTPTETGVDVEQATDDALGPVRAFAEDPFGALPALPELNWSFELPTGCSAIAVPGFGDYITSIDICEFQPMFHDLMGIVWVLGGLFGALSHFWRNVYSNG